MDPSTAVSCWWYPTSSKCPKTPRCGALEEAALSCLSPRPGPACCLTWTGRKKSQKCRDMTSYLSRVLVGFSSVTVEYSSLIKSVGLGLLGPMSAVFEGLRLESLKSKMVKGCKAGFFRNRLTDHSIYAL